MSGLTGIVDMATFHRPVWWPPLGQWEKSSSSPLLAEWALGVTSYLQKRLTKEIPPTLQASRVQLSVYLRGGS